jgi:hypothetical protein
LRELAVTGQEIAEAHGSIDVLVVKSLERGLLRVHISPVAAEPSTSRDERLIGLVSTNQEIWENWLGEAAVPHHGTVVDP